MKRARAVWFTLGTLILPTACAGGGGIDGGTIDSAGSGAAGDSPLGGQQSGAALGGGGSPSSSAGAAGETLGAGAPTSSAGSQVGGAAGSAGALAAGGAVTTGGAGSMGGASPEAGAGASSAGAAAGAAGGNSGQAVSGSCSFAVTTQQLSPQMATVGIVEWSANGTPSDAKIVYALDQASPEVLNRGGEAPVDLERPSYRTLLLGLKQDANYSFFIEATIDGEVCVSQTYALPPTGTLSGSTPFTVDVTTPAAREPGFIVATSGYAGNPDVDTTAFILDADGDTVWATAAPPDASRAKMDYEGNTLWMLGVNFGGGVGEMRYISMDGQTGQKDVAGLERAHHDFTVMPGGKLATMAWTDFVFDPESDLVIRLPDGTVETAFRIGSDLYASPEGRYHSNAIHYVEEDDSFTISDRNPNLIVKVSASGELQWQLGGSCDGAPAGPDKCSAQDWLVNHGHHLLSDGTLVLFNNAAREDGGNSYVIELDIAATASSMSATLLTDYEGTAHSGILGDVQRLPGGNTLITYSDAAQIVEVDAAWQVVQTFNGSIGYADWRPTLYGPPARL